MQINDAQVKVLLRYTDEIKWQLGVSIGYSSVWGSCVDDENDFIIHEEGHINDVGGCPEAEVTSVHLIHAEDYDQHHAGIFVSTELKEFPTQEGACEALYRRVLTALEDGSLNANPTKNREVDGAKITVTKLGAPDTFSIKVEDEFSITGFNARPGHPMGAHREHKEVIEEMMAELAHLK